MTFSCEVNECIDADQICLERWWRSMLQFASSRHDSTEIALLKVTWDLIRYHGVRASLTGGSRQVSQTEHYDQ